ncbi:nucleic acid-binding protein [Halobacteriales archaeon QH_2_65_14]|nr:MAG: nucleic acid-binding protein [Halobacteriales archaeon QH_2_65_14]
MSNGDEQRDSGYDDFLDAIEDGEPYYLESPSGNGWLPPRIVDPRTGERDLEEADLPETGEVVAYTTHYVAPPDFADDAPYVVAIVEFGPVRVTGQLRDTDPDDMEIGQEVEIGVDRKESDDERLVVFYPV